jgi:hypothetical protein
MRSSIIVANVGDNNGPFARIIASVVSCAGPYLGSYRRNDVEISMAPKWLPITVMFTATTVQMRESNHLRL